MSDGLSLTADFWAKARAAGEERFHWLTHPVTRAHINERISGDHRRTAIDHWQAHFLPSPAPAALSIGCGFGSLERELVSRDMVQHVLGIDVSAGAIEAARAAAEQAGLSHRITYEVVDINVADLGVDRFDAVFGHHSVHHVYGLEHMFAAVRRALRPGGLLFLDEYVGVSKWQVSDDVLGLMNSIVERLPAKYRYVFGTNPPEARERMYRTSLRWFEDNDPSESVRSGEIIPVLRQYFDIVDERPYGGALLHLVLSMIAGNFDEADEADRTLLSMLVLLERELERSGRIGSDFSVIVAAPRTDW